MNRVEINKKLFLNKSVIKETSLIAIPMIIQGLVYELQSATDRAFLGNLKTEYVSAIGAAQMPFFASLEGIVAMAIGITIIVSHMFGAKKQKESVQYVKSAMFYNTIISILLFFAWEIWAHPILEFFKVDPVIIDNSVKYVRICAVFFLGLGIDTALSAMLQGIGKTTIIMYSGMIKVALNIFFSWVLIFGKFGFKKYNVIGAALGTVLSDIFAFAFLLTYCFVIKRKELGFGKPCKKDFSFKLYKEIFALGAPSGLEYLLWNFSNLILVRFINEFNYVYTSIYTITFGIQCIVYAMFSNYSRAALTLIGQSLGAGNKKKARDVFYNCLFINVIIILVADVFFVLFPKAILGVFLKETAVVNKAVKYLIFLGGVMIPQSLNVVCGNAIKGNANTKWMLLSQMFGSAFVISLSYLFIRGMHLDMMSIYLVIFLDELIRGTINFFYYRRKYLSDET